MQRFTETDTIVLDHSSQGNFTNNHLICSPNNPDIDFNDVFGGPPRRASNQGTRYSYGGNSAESFAFAGASRDCHRWSGLSENPVFGDDAVNSRRYLSHDFFDDIYGGNESSCSSRRHHDRDSLASNPGSRVLSPNRPLPPGTAEPFSSSSVPAQFSFPVKSINGTDLPIFGSSARNHHKNKDGALNGSSFYPQSPLSRFANQTDQDQEEGNKLKKDEDQDFQSSALQDISVRKVESSRLSKPDEMDEGNKLKKDSDIPEVPGNSSHFHFSVYKWASKGIPRALSRRGGNSSKLKEKTKLEKSSSASGRVVCEGMAKELLIVTSPDIDSLSMNNSVSFDADFTEIGQGQNVEQAVLPEFEPENQNTHQETVGYSPGYVTFDDSGKETKTSEVFVTSKSGKTEEQTPVATRKATRTTLQSFMSGTEVLTVKNNSQENKGNGKERSAPVYNASEKVKKEERQTATLDSKKGKENLQDSLKNSQDGIVKNRTGGKVREFVKLFNQDDSDKRTVNIDSESQSSRWKETGKFKSKDDRNLTPSMSGKADQKVRLPKGNKNQKPVASRADEFLEQIEKQHKLLEQIEKQHLEMMANTHKGSNISSGDDGSAASTAASIPDGSEAIIGEAYNSLQWNTLDEDNLPQAGGDKQKDLRAIDAKIQKWSNGKESNIRSLLSTLQYVLWTESGWKSVPLVDIIEANAVKRSYQKALLSLHPDKLQQKSATSQQKYLAEKVFDILQEAWTQFSSLGTV